MFDDRKTTKLDDLTRDGRLYSNPRLSTIEALIPNGPYASCHAADLLETPEGDILAVWFAGSDEGNSDISIVLSRLDKGSSQWTEPVKVSDRRRIDGAVSLLNAWVIYVRDNEDYMYLVG